MKFEELDFRTQVLLSLQRALWDMVTPELRAVAVGWQTGAIRVRFIYDRPVTDEDREIINEVEGYVIADFPEGSVTEFVADESPQGEPRSFADNEQWWAFLRYEA